MRNCSLQKIGEILGVAGFDGVAMGYQIDSRLIAPGDLFFALKGERSDGHKYLAEVAEKGAVGAVVSTSYDGLDLGLKLFRVSDVGEALRLLAKSLVAGRIVGITGSLGKTTTRDFAATLLEGKYRVYKAPFNYNTKLTYPLTLLNRPGDEEVLVMELGMTEPGDIARLCEIAQPEIALVTKVAWVHGAHFPEGIGQIEREKKRIFDRAAIKISSPENFSLEDPHSDLFLSEDGFVDEKGVRAYRFDLPFTQKHVRHNFLAAVSIARALKMSWDEINNQIGKLKLPKMRLEEIDREGILFINDAYNANPDSMKAALSNLPEPKPGCKRIAVLGMMVDMGDAASEIHREVGLFAQQYVDHLFVLGKEAAPIFEAFSESKKPAELYVSMSALSEKLKKIACPGDVVLLKASRVVGLEKLCS